MAALNTNASCIMYVLMIISIIEIICSWKVRFAWQSFQDIVSKYRVSYLTISRQKYVTLYQTCKYNEIIAKRCLLHFDSSNLWQNYIKIRYWHNSVVFVSNWLISYLILDNITPLNTNELRRNVQRKLKLSDL